MTITNSSTQPRRQKPKNTLLLDMALGGLASAIASLVSNPFEVIKTRFQLQRELSKGDIIYLSIKDCIRKMWKYEGFHGLQAGLTAAIAYQLVMNSFRLGAYEYFTNLPQLAQINADQPVLNLCKNFFIASTSGALGAYIGSPIFVVKTRLQTRNRAWEVDPKIPVVGQQYGYRGMMDGLQKVYQQGGLSLLYKNSTISAQRVFWGSGVQLSSYDQAKYLLSNHTSLQGSALHFTTSVFSAFVVTICMNPFDVVLSRVNNQNVLNPKYSGAIDCFKKMYATEGFGGFYKGFWSHYARLAPHVVVTFTVYEQLKLYAKGSSNRELLMQEKKLNKD